MRVGFVYNVRVGKGLAGSDEDAEFDPPETIEAIRNAIASHGHDVVGLEADRTLPANLIAADVDVVFNIAEGKSGRSREAQVPALLDLLGIPYTGSDPVTLGVALDKPLASTLVRAAGVDTPLGFVLTDAEAPLPADLRFPAIVKPAHEGSSKGISSDSIVYDERALREQAREVATRYRQPAFCEEYVSGREITVGLLGLPVRVLPPMEVVFLVGEPLPLYSFEVKLRFDELARYEVPASLRPDELAAIERASLVAFEALGCRDVARLDFRLHAVGVPHFLECNPLPGLGPEGDLMFIAEAAELRYEDLIGEILDCALRRLP